jgi:L-asparaginase
MNVPHAPNSSTIDQQDLAVIITGGTLDKVYHPERGELGFSTSIVPELLRACRLHREPHYETPFMLDSLDMQKEQRQKISKLCQELPSQNILITHGTDTMVETALCIENSLCLEKIEKTIILTGAMVPARLPQSDAPFNLGYALSCLDHLSAGVYIAMNGRVFSPQHCRKDREKGIFNDHIKNHDSLTDHYS